MLKRPYYKRPNSLLVKDLLLNYEKNKKLLKINIHLQNFKLNFFMVKKLSLKIKILI